MILVTTTGDPSPRPSALSLQFIAFELLPIADGALRLSQSSTYLDEGQLEFVNDVVETKTIWTIEEAVAAIRSNLTEALATHLRKEH
jgi:hypothetical protein